MPAKGYSGSKFKGSMCIEIIDMFAEGKTSSQFCARHNISDNTLHRWLDTYPMFADAWLVANEKAKAYYESLINDHLIEEYKGPKLNMQAIQLIYRTRFEMPQNRIVRLGLTKRTAEEKLESICEAVENGKLTADEAQKLATLVESTIKAKEHEELVKRLEQLEQANKLGASDDDFVEVPSGE